MLLLANILLRLLFKIRIIVMNWTFFLRISIKLHEFCKINCAYLRDASARKLLNIYSWWSLFIAFFNLSNIINNCCSIITFFIGLSLIRNSIICIKIRNWTRRIRGCRDVVYIIIWRWWISINKIEILKVHMCLFCI